MRGCDRTKSHPRFFMTFLFRIHLYNAKSCQANRPRDILNFIAEVKAKDASLGKKILNAIKNLLKKWGLIIEDYKDRSLDTAEAQALSQLEDTFKKLQEMYQEAFMDANETYSAIGNIQTQKNTNDEGDVKFAYREHYWRSGFSHIEMSYVERIAKNEVETTDNYIDAENKWLYNNRKNKPYFALYSTAHIDNPTVMYASKGSQATKDYKWFMDFIDEVEMTKNERDDLRRKTIDEVLTSFGYALDKGGLHSGKPTTTRNNRNVRVHRSASGVRPSEALLNCIRNIGDKQERENGVKQYSDRDYEGRANKQGDFINEFYPALSKAEWKAFYNGIADNGYLEKTEIGTIAPIVAADKLVIAKRLYTGKKAHDYVVRDVFQLQETYNGDSLDAIKNAIKEGDLIYDRQTMYQNLSRFLARNQSAGILARFDADSQQYVVGDTPRVDGKSNERIHGDSQEGAFGEKVSSQDKPSVRGTDGLLKSYSDRDSDDSSNHSSDGGTDTVVYDESQYNNFGWVRANDVLTTAEYNTLLSRYADYKHNKDRYPTTRFGEAVIHSSECPDVIMYVKGNIRSPQISKIVVINKKDSTDISVIREEIILNEYERQLLPFSFVEEYYGKDVLVIHKARDYASYRQFRAEQEGKGSQGGNTSGRTEQNREGSSRKGERIYSQHEEIKLQEREPYSVSNRSLLVNALSSTAQNADEKQRLLEYKSNIRMLDAEQDKLQNLNKQIKELSFSTGVRDTKKLDELKKQAKATANRINYYDKKLLELESVKAIKDVLSREKKKAVARQKQKNAEHLKEYKEKALAKQAEITARYQESRKKAIESREKTAMRHKIKKVVAELNELLLRGTKEKHVMIELQKAVAEALDAVNMDTVGADERVANRGDSSLDNLYLSSTLPCGKI